MNSYNCYEIVQSHLIPHNVKMLLIYCAFCNEIPHKRTFIFQIEKGKTLYVSFSARHNCTRKYARKSRRDIKFLVADSIAHIFAMPLRLNYIYIIQRPVSTLLQIYMWTKFSRKTIYNNPPYIARLILQIF